MCTTFYIMQVCDVAQSGLMDGLAYLIQSKKAKAHLPDFCDMFNLFSVSPLFKFPHNLAVLYQNILIAFSAITHCMTCAPAYAGLLFQR